MKANRNIIQSILVFIGLFLIFATYFFYPKISEKKLYTDQFIEDKTVESTGEETNTFENVEYRGFYDINKPFIVKSDRARILDNDPDIVYMTNMHVALNMNDGRVIVITSNKGSYNKVSYDCLFEDNVKAIDGETTVLAENLDLLASEDVALVYNNVFLTNDKGSLWADKVDYDFETKYYKISMYSDEKVKIKLIKWAI